MSLVIWFKNGQTALFEQVEECDIHEGVIEFKYYGKSTNVKRQAIFCIENIAGFAEQVN